MAVKLAARLLERDAHSSKLLERVESSFSVQIVSLALTLILFALRLKKITQKIVKKASESWKTEVRLLLLIVFTKRSAISRFVYFYKQIRESLIKSDTS